MRDYKNKSGFNRNGPSRPSFGSTGPRKFGGNDTDRPRQMHRATCSQCHNPCEVPFVPNGKKPVYCTDCFVKDADDAPRDSYPRREFAPRPAFKRDAPVPCEDRGLSELAGQLKAVNEKLDRLVRLMENSVQNAIPEVVKEPVKVKRVAKKSVSKKK